MKEIAITGVGIISNKTSSFTHYEKSFSSKYEIEENEKFDDDLEDILYSAKINVRRNDKATKMILAAVLDILCNNYNLSIVPERRGMILNTEIGTISAVYDYLNPVIKHGVAAASPALFPNTVINSSIGKVSRQLKLKGSSFMFCETNPIKYASMLLEQNVDDMVIVGCVDEGIELYEEISACRTAKKTEMASAMVLEPSDKISNSSQNVIGYITGYSSARKIKLRTECYIKNICDSMMQAINDANVSLNDISCIVSMSKDGDYTIEKEAIKRLFGHSDIPIVSHYEKYGCCYSSDELLNVIDGILYLKSNNFNGYALINTANDSSISHFIVKKG